MHTLLEEKLCYPALALIVLVVFYGIYFGKVLTQKRHGIQTRQIGHRKEKEIHTVETFMSVATQGEPIAQLMSIAFGWNHLPITLKKHMYLCALWLSHVSTVHVFLWLYEGYAVTTSAFPVTAAV